MISCECACFRRRKRAVGEGPKPPEGPTEPAGPTFLIEVHRKIQTLFILQAIILTLLCLHSVLLLCVSGWNFRADVFVSHWTHAPHPYLEVVHTLSNLGVFVFFAKSLPRHQLSHSSNKGQWLPRAQQMLNRFTSAYSFLCFFDTSLLFFTDAVFLLLAAAVFLLRYLQLHLVSDMSLAVTHLSASVLVENLLHDNQRALSPSTRRGRVPKTLVRLFDLRKASIRASVLWSCLLTLYNITSNLQWLAFGSSSPYNTGLMNQTLLPQAQALFADLGPQGSVLEQRAAPWGGGGAGGQATATFLWHQPQVPVLSESGGLADWVCPQLPVVLPEPVSVEHSLSFLEQCQGHVAGAAPSERTRLRLNGLRLFEKANADFLGVGPPKKNGCPVVPWAPSCTDTGANCAVDFTPMQAAQASLVQQMHTPSAGAGLVWHVPVTNPGQEPYRSNPHTWLVSLNRQGFSKSPSVVKSRLCLSGALAGPKGKPSLLELAPSLPMPLGWVSLRLQYHELQHEPVSAGVKSPFSPGQALEARRQGLLHKALHTALQTPYLLHALQRNRYWVFCSRPDQSCGVSAQQLSQLDALLSASAWGDAAGLSNSTRLKACLSETEFWVHLQIALEVLQSTSSRSEGLFASRNPRPGSGWPPSWLPERIENIDGCQRAKKAVLMSVMEDLRAWSGVMQRTEPQVFLRNWLLTLFLGAILLRKAHITFLRYNLVPLHFGQNQVKVNKKEAGEGSPLVVVFCFVNNSQGRKQKFKLRLGEKTGSGALLLYTLHLHVWKNVLLFSFLVLVLSLLAVALLTSNRHPHSLWPTHAWFFNALVNTKKHTTDVRDPGLYFILLITVTVLCAAVIYGVCSMVLKPVFFFWFLKRLKKKGYKHTNPEHRDVLKALYLRTFAMHEGLVFNVLVVVGWVIQGFYSSPWPWKYTPWFLIPTQAWDLALFVNCVYMPVVLTFGLHYVLECVAYESLFWKRASPRAREQISAPAALSREQEELHQELLENENRLSEPLRAQGQATPTTPSVVRNNWWVVWLQNKSLGIQSLWLSARGGEWLPEVPQPAETVISESFLALLVLNSFHSTQNGSETLLLYHDGLLRCTVEKYSSLRKKLLQQRLQQLEHDLVTCQAEHDRLHKLHHSHWNDLQQKLC